MNGEPDWKTLHGSGIAAVSGALLANQGVVDAR